jgi:predicted P-loop ATPase
MNERGFSQIRRSLMTEVSGHDAFLCEASEPGKSGSTMHVHVLPDDTAYTRAVSRYLWTALAGRIVTPGVKADMVPILVGGQGVGKSTGVSAMCPSNEFFTEVSFHEKEDDLARRMRGRLVGEIGELRGLHIVAQPSQLRHFTARFEPLQ